VTPHSSRDFFCIAIDSGFTPSNANIRVCLMPHHNAEHSRWRQICCTQTHSNVANWISLSLTHSPSVVCMVNIFIFHSAINSFEVSLFLSYASLAHRRHLSKDMRKCKGITDFNAFSAIFSKLVFNFLN
jgi:hypothetical protein